jgi:hypothetical protein
MIDCPRMRTAIVTEWILNLQRPVKETGYRQRVTVDHRAYSDRHSTPLLSMINSPFLGIWRFSKNQSLYYSHNTSVPEPSSSYLVDRPYPVNTRTPLYFTRREMGIASRR